MKMKLWQLAEDEAVKVFAGNLRDLLLAAPAGARPTLGLDPGYRTGVKVAVVDATGKVVATDTIYPHEPKRQWDESLATLARLCRVHQVELDRHRQRHGLARDRQARGRAGLEASGPDAHQDHGLGSRRLGLFRIGLCQPGAARSRRVLARRGLHRAPPAGSAGGTREDRPEIHRRRAVPARSRRVQALPLPRRGGGGLRERGRRRSQHRLGPAARPRVRPRRLGRAEHRDPSRCQRPVQDPQGADQGLGPRPENLRAGGGLPAHPERRRSARCLRRSPGSLSGGAPHSRGHEERHQGGDRQRRRPEEAQSRKASRTRSSACRR